MIRELASRAENGILVDLFWDVEADLAVVHYTDDRTGDAFVARVPKSHALEAFRHPNAYRPMLAAA
jgi:putative hemolysin